MCAAPHIREKPSLPSEPPAEGQTRQIYRQSRDDDRSEFKKFLCFSHLVGLNDSQTWAEFMAAGERPWLQWAQCSSFSQAMQKVYLARVTPMNMSPGPRLAPTHPCYSQPESSPAQKRWQLRSHLPTVHGSGYLELQSGCELGRNSSRGEKGRGRALPSALTGAWHPGSTCCENRVLLIPSSAEKEYNV